MREVAGQAGLAGPVFLGVAGPVLGREIKLDDQTGVFITKHSPDMKLSEPSDW